jgi:putative Holliday junction resolvase
VGRIVGIDFGKVRIGLAISDERKIIAQSLETIKAGKTHAETAATIVHALLPYKNIEAIVIGMPLLMNGKESEMSGAVRLFAEVLKTQLPYPIHFWDERLTSAGVEKMLIDMDVSRKKRAQLSDALSAVSILQNYLDSL